MRSMFDNLHGIVSDPATGELLAVNPVPREPVAAPRVVSDPVGSGQGIGEWLSDPANLAQWLPAGQCAVDAASYGGVGSWNINRPYLYLEAASSNYTVTSTAYADVDPVNLAGAVQCTGRPLLCATMFIGTKGNTYLQSSIALDGVVVFGRLTYTEAAGNVQQSGFAVHTSVQPGPHRFSLQAAVDAGAATIYATPAVNAVRMLVVEL